MARIEESYPAHSKSINAQGRFTAAEVHYIVFDVSSEDEALQYALSVVPSSLDGIGLSTLDIDERLDETTFSINAVYRDTGSGGNQQENEEEEDDTPVLEFNCGNSEIHIVEAIEQTRIFGTLDAGKVIGWNGKKDENIEIAGVEVPAPSFHEKYIKKMSTSSLTTSYKRKVGMLVGKVNKFPFMGWNPGEVMFEGINFSTPIAGRSVVEVSFDFAIRPNEKDLIFCGRKVSKKGFDYLWAIPGTFVDENTQKPNVTPVAAFQAQVMQYADFSVLGL